MLKLLRAYLELDRDHALWEHEHRIDPPAEPRDVELEVDPGGGGGERRVGLLVASGEKLAHGRGVEGGVRVFAEREISADEIEAIISHPEFEDLSRSSGLPVAFGHLMDGRLVIVVYRWVDQVTVQPITAYEVPE